MLIRKKRGNFLEDFRVGQLFRHKVGKTVTEGLFNAFTEFGMTTNPLCKNLRYAQRYGFRGLLAPPGLVMNIVFSQSVEDISENARANLEYSDMRFGTPVYIGDTIEVETTIVGVHPSSREPDRGVVHVQTTGRNQNGEVVLAFQRKVQVVYGGIPFNLCLGLSCPDVGDNTLGDVCYVTGRHTGPVFVGDTVFTSTEITGKRDYPGRPDLGVVAATLRGHKFVRKGEAWEKMEIFYLEREMAVKRRSHYA